MPDMIGDGIALAQLDAYVSESYTMTHIAQPEEIADATLYLADPRSRFVTTSMLCIEGWPTSWR